ncbi:MAG: efflux RND transporter periplasmic adaptor subunit [Tannerella sp.]|nr:efflux RND transporter periplasmic adaptor subunit [Tannerella sp.]
MKKYMICFFVAIALISNGCRGKHNHNEDDGHNHATEEAHEHFEGDGHDHSAHHHDEGDGHDHSAHHHDEGEVHAHEADGEHTDEIHFSAEQAEAVGLEVIEIEPAPFSRVVKTSGRIQATQGDEATLAATSDGIVSFVNPSISDGIAVRAGEAVVTVSARNLQNGDRSAIAVINYETEQKAYQRAEELSKAGIISAKDFEEVRRRYETAKTAYEAQAANITARGVTVTSPISGFIKNRLVNQGEYVTVGQPIATITQNRRLQLRAEAPEKYYRTLKDVRTANFRTAYDETLYKTSDMRGRLLSLGKSSGNESFYVPITFEFDNTGDILPGSFAEVYLLTAPIEAAIAVPVAAITEEQGLYFVYIQLDEEGYRKQEVRLGPDDGERVQILSGLKSGDRVVVKGVYQVKLAAISSIIPEGHTHSH